MNNYKCVIIDDEVPALDLLNEYVSRMPKIHVDHTFQSPIKALDYLSNHSIDLVFLDVRMPVINGLSLLKSLSKKPSIIITTAYREYAVEGYDLDIIDYLLKPITFDRFVKSVNRFTNKRAFNQQSLPKYLHFNVNKTIHRIKLGEVTHLESLKDYTKIHTIGHHLVVKGNLGQTMKKFPEKLFLRVHRSFAISLQHLEWYNHQEVSVYGHKIPIGSNYKEAIKMSI